MTMAEALLDLAEELAGGDIGGSSGDKTRRAVVRRRAISTAYYAVFHALTRLCAKELVAGSPPGSQEYEIVYRALNHGSLKEAFNKEPLRSNPALKEIGNRVIELQTARNLADYLPIGRFNRIRAADEKIRGDDGKMRPPSISCRKLVQAARSTLKLIADLSSDDRRTLAVYLILKSRT
ncbi:hypothetical protein [Methylosinus sp. Sm6]|uniref:hypothetical protein n=1 Tax=Methylosinus sp. Sm6 TaxID=2866948 RepID=UPI001C99826F|nr:hypothetical protein [Methylosinus sp. Sm6]MBY6240992.1 hypothetical protein [Methylosinus sp. Sm6]